MLNNTKERTRATFQDQEHRSPWLWVPSLSFADGLPLVTIMTLSVILYKQLGLSNAEITFYTSWLYLPWILKPVWSPLINVVKTKRWWIVLTEVLLGAAFGGVAFTIPTSFWLQGSLFFFWVIAFAGASHCISADGFYMLGLNTHQQATFMGIRSLFDRLATIFAQGVLVMIAGNLQVVFRNSISYSWSLTFFGVTGLFLLLWLWHNCALPRPQEDAKRPFVNFRTIGDEFTHTFRTFFAKEQIWVALMFIIFFRMPEGLMEKVSALFLIDSGHNGGLGLSPQEYGLVQGTVGIIGVSLGGILGGILAGKDGLKRWIWPMALAFFLPQMVYLLLSYTLSSSLWIISLCVFVEQFGYGFGLTAYTLYLIYYSRGEYKTSHYALGSAIMSLSMMLPGLVSGALQDTMGYRHFFTLSLVFSLLTLLVVGRLKIDKEFGKAEQEQGQEQEQEQEQEKKQEEE